MVRLTLSQIERLQFAFEGSKETFSFAEAAMLIQGSACIYSKKVGLNFLLFDRYKRVILEAHTQVEYLYSLVYETLDLIASKKFAIDLSLCISRVWVNVMAVLICRRLQQAAGAVDGDELPQDIEEKVFR